MQSHHNPSAPIPPGHGPVSTGGKASGGGRIAANVLAARSSHGELPIAADQICTADTRKESTVVSMRRNDIGTDLRITLAASSIITKKGSASNPEQSGSTTKESKGLTTPSSKYCLHLKISDSQHTRSHALGSRPAPRLRQKNPQCLR